MSMNLGQSRELESSQDISNDTEHAAINLIEQLKAFETLGE
jgi:hypothetical protein